MGNIFTINTTIINLVLIYKMQLLFFRVIILILFIKILIIELFILALLLKIL